MEDNSRNWRIFYYKGIGVINMIPRPKEVKSLEEYKLKIIFDNGEKKFMI